ncbi:MAG: DUF4258 domain-containing protein [Dehalococcoidia bacterium]|nr:DUF4258 domain-containing protein [Dehalococcoidia bacterium]MDZ4277998.1 DUF4258 domain-containing protein [Dehalococcoidia bacterium]
MRQAEERRITFREMREAVLNEAAESVEDFPEDRRGASCLIFGLTKRGRMLHVQVSYPPEVAVITAYEPDLEKWIDGRRRRT